MNLLGKELVSVLALAMALVAPLAPASDASWASSGLPDSSAIVPLPERLTFEEAAVAGNEQAAALPTPGVVAVPEPTTYVLLLAGIGLMAFIILRKR